MNKETCRHGLSMTEHHCPLCMNEGKGARPAVFKDCQAYQSTESECESLRQQLAESERQRETERETQEKLRHELVSANQRIADLTAQLAQYQREASQAEPAAWRVTAENWAYSELHGNKPEYLSSAHKIEPLYTTPQPAAVAVVLPNEPISMLSKVMLWRSGWDNDADYVRRLNAITTTVQELAQLRGCEQDAARYRWLRSQHTPELNSANPETSFCVFMPTADCSRLIPVGSKPGQLDEIIDAAIASQKQEKK